MECNTEFTAAVAFTTGTTSASWAPIRCATACFATYMFCHLDDVIGGWQGPMQETIVINYHPEIDRGSVGVKMRYSLACTT